jgi:hypothetical protein
MRWRDERRCPRSRTPGFELIAADVENGTIGVAFAATEAFTTPMGDNLGGFLAAMLYDSSIHMLPVPATQFCVYCCLTSAIKSCRVLGSAVPRTMRSPIKRGSAQAPATGGGG